MLMFPPLKSCPIMKFAAWAPVGGPVRKPLLKSSGFLSSSTTRPLVIYNPPGDRSRRGAALRPMQAIPVFYADEIVAESGGYSPSAGKPKAVAAAWEHAGLPIELRPVVPATVEELCLAHDSDFVRLVLACQVENGFGNKRADVARSLPYTCGAMLGAASVALQSGVACAPVSGLDRKSVV